MKLSSSGVFFPLIYFHPLLLPPFTLNGDSGDRWREVLTLLPPPAPPHPPLLSISPLPWCLFLNYISTLASTATLFTHCSIHIHLACTCLVPVRVTWRERTLKTYTCTTHTHTHTGSHTYAQALPWDREGVNERWRCQRGKEKWGRREKMKISGRKKGGKWKRTGKLNGEKRICFPFLLTSDSLVMTLLVITASVMTNCIALWWHVLDSTCSLKLMLSLVYKQSYKWLSLCSECFFKDQGMARFARIFPRIFRSFISFKALLILVFLYNITETVWLAQQDLT